MSTTFARPQPTLRRFLVVALVAAVLAGALSIRGATAPSPVLADHCPTGQVHLPTGGCGISTDPPVVIPQCPFDKAEVTYGPAMWGGVGGQVLCLPITEVGGQRIPDFGFLPYRLLNPDRLLAWPYASSDLTRGDQQRASLLNLERQAVLNALTNHQRPLTEFASMQAWGRGESQAELWGLMTDAIRATHCGSGPPGVGCRTVDQQRAVDWMVETVNRRNIEVAKEVGREFVRWGGLNAAAFDALVDRDPEPSWTELEDFLDATPSSFGFCPYAPPFPFEGEYTGDDSPYCVPTFRCDLICPDLPYPPLPDLAKWGTARWSTSATAQFDIDYLESLQDISWGLLLGGSAFAALTGATIAGTLASVMASSGFTQVVFPFAIRAVAEGWAVNAGAIGAGAIATGVGVAIFAIVVSIIRGIQVGEIDAYAGKVAEAITTARTTFPDLNAMLDDGNGASDLFGLFITATTPSPDIEGCNNLIVGEFQPGCLNAPAIPAAAPDDPRFVVMRHDVAGAVIEATSAPTIDYLTQIVATPGTATSPAVVVEEEVRSRLHGTWFVHDEATFDLPGTWPRQSLKMRFFDWDRVPQVAAVYRLDVGGYAFVGMPVTSTITAFDPDTCIAAGTCWTSDRIEYLRNDGPYSAFIGELMAWGQPAPITYGTPLTAAQLGATAGVPGAISYSIGGTPVTPGGGTILDAGEHVIVATLTPPIGVTFPPVSVTRTLTVDTAPLTITADDHTKTYGRSFGFNPLSIAEVAITGLLSDDAVDDVQLSTTGAPPETAVGEYPILVSNATGDGLANYSIEYVEGTLTVEPAPLTITASSHTIVLGGSAAITPGYAGFVLDDGPDDLASLPTCSTAAGAAVGTFPSTCSGAAGTNYAIDYVSGIVRVTYGLAIRFDQTKRYRSGANVPVKIELVDANGINRSAASIAVSLGSPAVAPNPAPGAQPTGTFKFVTDGPRYQFNLRTRRFPAGSYTLTFVVAGDPVPHAVSFKIR